MPLNIKFAPGWNDPDNHDDRLMGCSNVSENDLQQILAEILSDYEKGMVTGGIASTIVDAMRKGDTVTVKKGVHPDKMSKKWGYHMRVYVDCCVCEDLHFYGKLTKIGWKVNRIEKLQALQPLK
jgi:hypothetical protein